jgi:DNA invertase Pin-like site-specific DNA recombinase
MDPSQLRGKRVAIYARYSSHLQREASIEDQVRRCSEYVSGKGGEVAPELIFSDSATSGASLARPAFERMMELLNQKPPRLDAIVTEDISRISRDFADAAFIFQRLRFLDVPLLGVADGIDTSAKNAKVTFTIKSLVSDLYLDELRDKTLRGLEGRCLAGYSTGGLPYGYRSEPVKDQFDRVIGHQVVVDEDQARIIRKIFKDYLEGRSVAAIACTLNRELEPPPRAKSLHRRKGWIASTIRAFLHNEAYVGRWTFKRRQWVKIPGTNTRRPRSRSEAEVIRAEYAERRIVDEVTWEAVQTRLAEVRACYRGPAHAELKGKLRRPSGRQNHYVLSGLIYCGECGAPMTIHAGTSARYYRCSDQKKRGTCTNRLALREDVARRRIFGALHDRFRTPAAVSYMRKRIAEHLRALSKEMNAELEDRRARLQRVEAKIAGLIEFIATGERSDYIAKTLRDYEAQAKQESAAIEVLVEHGTKPIELPSTDVVIDHALDLERIIETDPVRAREELKKLFEGGKLFVKPQPEGHYVAESRVYPFALLTLDLDVNRGPQTGKARHLSAASPPFGPDSHSVTASLCGPAVVARGGFEPPTFGL